MHYRTSTDQLLAAIVDSSDDAIISKTLDGVIRSWNTAAERMFGYTAAEAIGRHISILIPPDRADEEDQIIRRLRTGERVDHYDTVRVRRDGRMVQVSLTISPVRDASGQVVGASKIARDIDERKRLEAEATERIAAARLLAAIVDSSDDAIISKTLDGVIRSWNTAAERLFGYSAAEAIGRHVSLLIPAERIEEEDHIIGRLSAGERVDHFDTVRVRRDGLRVQVSLTISPIRDESGKVVGASKIAREIGERKRLEMKLQQTAERLAEADHRKDEFIAMMAHELRNPLAPIRNAVHALRLTGGSAEVQSATAMMDRQIGQLVRLLDDLLDISRINRGRIELRYGRAELASIVHQAVEAARTLVLEMKQDLTVRLPEQPIWLNADPARLAQVIGNLLNNASKFTDKGGRIALSVERQGHEAVLRVGDNGIGIATGNLSRIFDLFMQIDTSLERSVSGLGIGLTLVKNLVEMHGGTVLVTSDGIGKGSEFEVRLPILTTLPPPQSEAVDSTPTKQIPRRILVVDDNRDSAESLAMLLKLTDNTLHIAYDGEAAVQAAASFRPDVVLMDIGLPKLNGYEACRRIREQSWGRRIAMIALTGWGQEEDRLKSNDAGFNGHLVKPVDFATLMKLLATPVSKD